MAWNKLSGTQTKRLANFELLTGEPFRNAATKIKETRFVRFFWTSVRGRRYIRCGQEVLCEACLIIASKMNQFGSLVKYPSPRKAKMLRSRASCRWLVSLILAYYKFFFNFIFVFLLAAGRLYHSGSRRNLNFRNRSRTGRSSFRIGFSRWFKVVEEVPSFLRKLNNLLLNLAKQFKVSWIRTG